MTQSEYVIVPWNYEELLVEGHMAELLACQRSHTRRVAELQEQHAEEHEEWKRELANTTQKAAELKRTNLMWRTKAVFYKMNLVSSYESAQLTLAQLRSSQTLLAGVVHERDSLLRSNKALQEQVQCLTTLCQGQHRAKVQQQSELASTSAEAKQLHEELLQVHGLSEVLAEQLADERASHGVTRDQVQSLRSDLDQRQEQLQAQLSVCKALQADVKRLQEALSQEQEVRASADARAEKLSKDLALREAELATAVQGAAVQVHSATERIEQIRALDSKVIEQLQQSVYQLNENLSRERQLAAEDRQRFEAQLQQERSARDALERECAQQRKCLLQERSQVSEKDGEVQRLQTKLAAMDVLRRQIIEKDAEAQRLQDRIAAMERLRRQLDEKDMEMQRLQDKIAAMEVLRRQISEKEVEVEVLQGKLLAMEKLRRQASDRQVELELLQDRLAAAEKAAARVADLEGSLERTMQQLGQQASNKDAAVKALREQVEQQRKALEHKEELLRDTEAAHARQIELFQKRLADNEAAAREQETQLRQLMDKAAQVGSAEAQAQQRLAELQASLASRDERIRQLQEERIADAAQSDARLQQVRADHSVQVAESEARIRQLQQQLAVMPSPMEPQRHQVRSANAAVDKLMGNLLGNGGGLLGAALGDIDDDDEDDECGPSAHLILNMSQPQMPLGDKGVKAGSNPAVPAAAPEEAAAVSHEAAAGPAANVAEPQAQPDEATADPLHAGRASGSKRAHEEPVSVEERPVGRGRGRKAAKGANALSEDQQAKVGDEPLSEEVPRGGRRKRTVQARGKAVAAAASSDAGSDAEGVDEDVPEAKAAPRVSQRRGKAAAATAAAAQTASPEDAAEVEAPAAAPGAVAAAVVKPPAPKRRGRTAKGSQGKAAEAVESDAEAQLPGPSQQAPVQAQAAIAMPPPLHPSKARPVKVAPLADSYKDAGAADEIDVHVAAGNDIPSSQPLTQPQPHAQPCNPASLRQQRPELISSLGMAAENKGGAEQQGPATSQFSMFSQGLKPHAANIGRNPLTTLNQRVIEQAKSRVRLVPLTALQQLKPFSKVVPPSIVKGHVGPQQGATKRAPLQGEAQEANVIPSDVLIRALQPPPTKVGKTGK